MPNPRLPRGGSSPGGRRGTRTASPAAMAGLAALAALTGVSLASGIRLYAEAFGDDSAPATEPTTPLPISPDRAASTGRDAPPPQRRLLPEGTDGRVTGYADGDTLLVDGRAVDLIGVETDSGACDKAARRLIERELPIGEWVRLEFDERTTGSSGQALAYVHRYSSSAFLNERLLLEGLARARERQPNTRHSLGFSIAEGKARQHHAARWGPGC